MPDEQTVLLSTRIAKGLKQKLKVRCVEDEITITQFVLEALQAKLKKSAAAE